jgi:hypothetical protein
VTRGIDHLVLAVNDLAAARRGYESLGFTTTPPATHPFGTGNSLAQLRNSFIELLAVVEPAKIAPAGPGQFSFADFNARFLERRQGLSMLVLQSGDAVRDQAEFAASGLDTYSPLHFSRLATLPDGSRATVAFSLAFVTDRRMPEAVFFVCQHHAPEHFWQPAYQRHANGASRIIEVVMIANDPPAFVEFFGKLLPGAPVTAAGDDRVIDTGDGIVTLTTPARFARRFPGLAVVNAPRTPYFAGYAVAVKDCEYMAGLLDRRGVAFTRRGGHLRVAPNAAFGAFIEFRRR